MLLLLLLLVCVFTYQTTTKKKETRAQDVASLPGKNISLLERKTLS